MITDYRILSNIRNSQSSSLLSIISQRRDNPRFPAEGTFPRNIQLLCRRARDLSRIPRFVKPIVDSLAWSAFENSAHRGYGSLSPEVASTRGSKPSPARSPPVLSCRKREFAFAKFRPFERAGGGWRRRRRRRDGDESFR